MNARTHTANLLTPSDTEIENAVERHVEDRIRNINDDYLCREILPEFDVRSDQFLSFLKAVREMNRFEIGDRFLAYLGAHFEGLIDRGELSESLAEDALADAIDARRDAEVNHG